MKKRQLKNKISTNHSPCTMYHVPFTVYHVQARRAQGQSLLEYSILIIVVVAVFLAMEQYVKRGIQGRWKASADSMGEQYDPRAVNSMVNFTLNSVSNTSIDIVQGDNGGYWTKRVDTTQSTETKGGDVRVGATSNKPVKFDLKASQ